MFRKIIVFFIITLFPTICFTENNFFDDAKKKFNEEKLEESKFLFQRNIVFNPKHAISYLYLAKIYHSEDNKKEEEKNLNATLLLEPSNEEAMNMLINIELDKSNYSKVKELTESLSIICIELCGQIEIINKNLKNIEPENKS
tara:strand:+ start:541 stop:969 length:429 start_codon:yes stop_codon:yes gene_type:complete